ncbi:Tap42 interacting protein [Oleoguttula sp. CCFEE 5521]
MSAMASTVVDPTATLNALLEQYVHVGGLITGIAATTSGTIHISKKGYADVLHKAPVENDHQFGIGSITKTFVAVVVLQLIEEGKLRLTDNVSHHLKEYVYRDIDCMADASIKQLLSHRAGIDNWEADPVWLVNGRGRDIRPSYVWEHAETLEYIRRPKRFAPEPGNYYYADTNYTVLGLIIEEVTQTTAAAQIRRRILDPLGLHRTCLEGFEERDEKHAPRRYHLNTTQFRDSAGISDRFSIVNDELIDVTVSNLSGAWLAGGMISTAADLLKFGAAMQQNKLLTRDSVAVMQSFQPATPGLEMGCGLFRLQTETVGPWFGHFGAVLGFSAGLWWQDDCVVCLLTNVGTLQTGEQSAVTTLIRIMATTGMPAATMAPGPSAGVESFTTENGQWKITTRKQPILKAEPIEELHKAIGIPIPEMIFGDNYVAIEHVQTRWKLDFNAKDALDCVSKTEEGMLQVAVADAWKKDREHNEDIKQVVKPFDWSYSTDYKGTTQPGQNSGDWLITTQAKHPVRADLLSRPDPILFFGEVDLYEDELADNGIGLLSIKIRVMPDRLLLLSRFFLRLDDVIVRIRDTRIYIEHSSNTVVRQYTAKEAKYDELSEKLRGMRENVAEALREPNRIAPLLNTIEDRTEVFEVH